MAKLMGRNLLRQPEILGHQKQFKEAIMERSELI
jgi:hypothetical protein